MVFIGAVKCWERGEGGNSQLFTLFTSVPVSLGASGTSTATRSNWDWVLVSEKTHLLLFVPAILPLLNNSSLLSASTSFTRVTLPSIHDPVAGRGVVYKPVYKQRFLVGPSYS